MRNVYNTEVYDHREVRDYGGSTKQYAVVESVYKVAKHYKGLLVDHGLRVVEYSLTRYRLRLVAEGNGARWVIRAQRFIVLPPDWEFTLTRPRGGLPAERQATRGKRQWVNYTQEGKPVVWSQRYTPEDQIPAWPGDNSPLVQWKYFGVSL